MGGGGYSRSYYESQAAQARQAARQAPVPPAPTPVVSTPVPFVSAPSGSGGGSAQPVFVDWGKPPTQQQVVTQLIGTTPTPTQQALVASKTYVYPSGNVIVQNPQGGYTDVTKQQSIAVLPVGSSLQKAPDVLQQAVEAKIGKTEPSIIQKAFVALPELVKQILQKPPVQPVQKTLPPASFGRDITAHALAQEKTFNATERQLVELSVIQGAQVRRIELLQKEKEKVPSKFGLSDAKVAALNQELNAAIAIANVATTQEEYDAAMPRVNAAIAANSQYNLNVTLAQHASDSFSEEEKKLVGIEKTVAGAYVGTAKEYLAQVDAYNKAIFAPKPVMENIPLTPKEELTKAVENIVFETRKQTRENIEKEGAIIAGVRTAGLVGTAALDVIAGGGSAALTASMLGYANVVRPVIGKQKLPYSAEQAFETGVAVRRPVSYVLPLVAPPLAPIMYGTATLDISQAKTFDEAIMPALSFVPFVAGYSGLKSVPSVARFFGAGTKTVAALAKGGKYGAIVVEKAIFPGVAGVAAYLSTEPALKAIEAKDYASAREIMRKMGVQFASYTIGGVATGIVVGKAGAMLKNFVAKPSVKATARVGVYAEETFNLGETSKQVGTTKIRTDIVSRESFFNKAKIQSLKNLLNPKISFTKPKISGETTFYSGPVAIASQRLANLNTRMATKMFLEAGKTPKAPTPGTTFEVVGAGTTKIKTIGTKPVIEPFEVFKTPKSEATRGISEMYGYTPTGKQVDIEQIFKIGKVKNIRLFEPKPIPTESFFEVGKLKQVSRAKPTVAGKALKPIESAFAADYRLNWRELADITEFSGTAKGKAFVKGQKPVPIEVTISKSYLKALQQQGIGAPEGGKAWTSTPSKSGTQTLMKNLVKSVSGTVTQQAIKGVEQVSFKGAGTSQAGLMFTQMNTKGGLYYGLYGIGRMAPQTQKQRTQQRTIFTPFGKSVFGGLGKTILGQQPKYKQAQGITDLLNPRQWQPEALKQATITTPILQTVTITVPKPFETTIPRPTVPLIPLFGIPPIGAGGFFLPKFPSVSEGTGGKAGTRPFYYNELFVAFGIRPMARRFKAKPGRRKK